MNLSPYATTRKSMVAQADPPTKKTRKPLVRVPLPLRALAHRLYVVEQLSWKEISERTGVNRKTLEAIGHRNRWIESKRSAAKAVEVKTNARIREEVDEIVEATAIQSAELSIGTLSKASVALGRDDVNAARDLQAYSQAAKNFVGIYRQARELDQMQSDQKGQTTVVFLGDLPRVERQEKRAIEVEVSLTPSTALPIAAIPMPLAGQAVAGEGQDTGSGVGQQATD